MFGGRHIRFSVWRPEQFPEARNAFNVGEAYKKTCCEREDRAGVLAAQANLLNEKERAPDDQPSIGIVLCAEKDNLEVDFALKTKGNPIGVANYHLQPDLPTELKGKLPSARQLANAVRPMLPPIHR